AGSGSKAGTKGPDLRASAIVPHSIIHHSLTPTRPGTLTLRLFAMLAVWLAASQTWAADASSSPGETPSATTQSAEAAGNPVELKTVDRIVIAVYGIGLLAVGVYFARRTRTTDDYLLGGRKMRSGSVGLSLFASLLSTITYLAIPGEMISKGPVILLSLVSIPIAYVVVGWLLIPYIMRLRVTSAYEILETRLGVRIRLLGSVIFLLTRLLWMALIIYITSDKIVVVMMGWPSKATPYVAIAIGLLTVVYTSMGGLRAVVFTDVIQSFILLGGAVLSIVLITFAMGGVGAWWPHEWSSGWDLQPVFSLDPHIRVTWIGSIVFMTVWWICTAGSDQMAIQRYLATRDVHTARRVFLTTGITNIVLYFVLAALGFALMGYFRAYPDLRPPGGDYLANADILFPYYIVHYLPAGVTGLVISGLLAAAMSSLSSGINSSCSVIGVDFVDRFRRCEVTDATRFQQTRIIAVVTGLIAVALSSLMGKVEGNIMEVTVRTNHVFVAPLFGLFFMAMFVPFATPFGTACGALAGCAVAVVIAYWDLLTAGRPLSFQWISLASLIVNLIVGCAVSRLSAGAQQRRQRGPY
ncbi:MAG: sodium/solute symporter, partial [Phycisphaerae bacterium]|nr:sodium/solute symporter [Phycisphaerae bacterium]